MFQKLFLGSLLVTCTSADRAVEVTTDSHFARVKSNDSSLFNATEIDDVKAHAGERVDAPIPTDYYHAAKYLLFKDFAWQVKNQEINAVKAAKNIISDFRWVSKTGTAGVIPFKLINGRGDEQVDAKNFVDNINDIHPGKLTVEYGESRTEPTTIVLTMVGHVGLRGGEIFRNPAFTLQYTFRDTPGKAQVSLRFSIGAWRMCAMGTCPVPVYEAHKMKVW